MFYTKNKNSVVWFDFAKKLNLTEPFIPTHNAVCFTGLLPSLPATGMFAREQDVVFFARYITEAHGTGTQVHTPVFVKYVELCALRTLSAKTWAG